MLQVFRGKIGMEPAAIKMFKPHLLGDVDRESLLQEVAILKSCRQGRWEAWAAAAAAAAAGCKKTSLEMPLRLKPETTAVLCSFRTHAGRSTWLRSLERLYRLQR